MCIYLYIYICLIRIDCLPRPSSTDGYGSCHQWPLDPHGTLQIGLECSNHRMSPLTKTMVTPTTGIKTQSRLARRALSRPSPCLRLVSSCPYLHRETWPANIWHDPTKIWCTLTHIGLSSKRNASCCTQRSDRQQQTLCTLQPFTIHTCSCRTRKSAKGISVQLNYHQSPVITQNHKMHAALLHANPSVSQKAQQRMPPTGQQQTISPIAIHRRIRWMKMDEG